LRSGRLEVGTEIDNLDLEIDEDGTPVVTSASKTDNKERVFLTDVGGRSFTFEIHGTQVRSDFEGCGANSMKVYFSMIVEDGARDDTSGPSYNASTSEGVEEPRTCEERSAENCAGRLAGAANTGCRWVEGIVSADPEGNCGVTTGACLAFPSDEDDGCHGNGPTCRGPVTDESTFEFVFHQVLDDGSSHAVAANWCGHEAYEWTRCTWQEPKGGGDPVFIDGPPACECACEAAD
jgi:hypothetical protein